jgi:hypothetical protein
MDFYTLLVLMIRKMFLAPELQTCEVWKYDGLIGVEERPVPLIVHFSDEENPQTPYSGWSTGIYLNDGIELFRSSSKIIETHPDGTQYVWYNPEYILRCALKSYDSGMRTAYIQLFADGSMKARLDSYDHFWSAPVLRPYVPYPCKDIIYFRDQGHITGREDILNYDAPHEVDCPCLRCAESPVKPVFEHADNCNCPDCCGYQETDDYYDKQRCYCCIDSDYEY